MPRGVRKTKNEGVEPSPSPAPLEQKDEVIQLDDGTYYRTVAGRKAKFNTDFPQGSILVDLLTSPENKEYFVVKATVIPDVKNPDKKFTALGQCERIPGDKFASLEKAETTAIGRALSHMSPNLIGAGASDDEIEKSKGVTAFQKSLRESVQEEAKPNPKAEPSVDGLVGQELTQYNEWAFNLTNCVTKEALVEYGNKIKEAKLPARVNEELRKLFNKQLRALAQTKENNNHATSGQLSAS